MMTKKLFLAGASALALGASTSAVRADFSNTVMSFNPVAYWQVNETNQPPPVALATNLGTLGATGNGNHTGLLLARASSLVGDTNKAISVTQGQVRVPYSPSLT